MNITEHNLDNLIIHKEIRRVREAKPPKATVNVTQRIADKVRYDMQEGMNMYNVSKKYSISREAVKKINENLYYPDPNWTPKKTRVRLRSKLTVGTVKEIRKQLDAGIPVRIIADKHSVSPCTIYDINRERTWTSVR